MKYKKVYITRKRLLDEWNNSQWSGCQYLVYGRAVLEDGKRYLPFKFILTIDYSDLWDGERDIPFDEYLEDALFSVTEMLHTMTTEEIVEWCNSTIRRYNTMAV